MNTEKDKQILSVSELLVEVVMRSLEVSLVDCNNPSDTMVHTMNCTVTDMMDSAFDHPLLCQRMFELDLLAHKVLFVASQGFLGISALVNCNLLAALVQLLFVVDWQVALVFAIVACKTPLAVAGVAPASLVVDLACVPVRLLLAVEVIRMVEVILMDLIAAAVVVAVLVAVVVVGVVVPSSVPLLVVV